MDLWGGLKVMPLYAEDGPTRWELTQKRFGDALTAANKIAQTTGLSALVSLYLESVIAATPEEVETFLSPLTARSKVREVVNGLAATRQIAIVPVGTQTMYHVAGSLPEFAEPEPVAPSEPVARPTFSRERPTAGTANPETRDSERRPSFERDRGGERPRTGPPRDRFAAAGSDRPRPRSAGGARPGGQAAADARCAPALTRAGNYPPRRKQFGASAGRPSRPRAEGTVLRFASLKRASRERTIRAGKKAPAVIANLSQSGHSDSALTAGRPAARAVRTSPWRRPAEEVRSRRKEVSAEEIRNRWRQVSARRSLEQGAENSRRRFGKPKFGADRPRPWKGEETRPPRRRRLGGRSVHAVNDLDQDLVHDLVSDLARDLGRDLTAAPANRGTGKNARSSAISPASRRAR